MHTRFAFLVPPVLASVSAFALGCSGHTSSIGDGVSSSSGGSGPSGGASGSSGGASGASGTSKDALFQTPNGTATPDSIYGTWGGAKADSGITFDLRLRLTKDSLTLATRCTEDSTGKVSGIIGVTTAARVTPDALVTLETKNDQVNDGTLRCSINITPREVKACTADMMDGFERNCFKLAGTQFTEFGDSSFHALQLTKLSD